MCGGYGLLLKPGYMSFNDEQGFGKMKKILLTFLFFAQYGWQVVNLQEVWKKVITSLL